MTVNDAPVGRPEDESRTDESLELLSDDAGRCTLVPVEATGDERLTQWISIERTSLCDVEEWR